MKDKKEIKIAYLHGLESTGKGPKNDFLYETFSEVYDPTIDYRDPECWDIILKDIKQLKPDYIVGSSMGGWFAYRLGKHLGIKTILFNPAIKKRSFDPYIPDVSKSYYPKHIVVLGRNDDVVLPLDTLNALAEDPYENYDISLTDEGHRTPVELFITTLSHYCV